MDAITITQDPGPVQTLDERIDFRFVVESNPEPSCHADLYFVERIATFDGQDVGIIESFTCEDWGAAVEAAREAQVYTLEERFDMYARMEQAAMGWGDFS